MRLRPAGVGQVQIDEIRIAAPRVKTAPRVAAPATPLAETPAPSSDTDEDRQARQQRFMKILEEAEKRASERKEKGNEKRRSKALRAYGKMLELAKNEPTAGSNFRTSV
jgi:hypothetical protein